MLAATWQLILIFALTVIFPLEYASNVDVEMTSSEEYELFTQNLLTKKIIGAGVASPKLLPCPQQRWHQARGVCLISRACPWSKILMEDNGACMRHHRGYVCCEVQRKRLPVDMFAMFL